MTFNFFISMNTLTYSMSCTIELLNVLSIGSIYQNIVLKYVSVYFYFHSFIIACNHFTNRSDNTKVLIVRPYLQCDYHLAKTRLTKLPKTFAP